MIKQLTILASAFILSACAVTNGTWDSDKSAIQACRGYTNTLVVLANYKAADKLTEAQIDTVDSTIDIVGPICQAEDIPDTQEAVDIVLTQAAKLNSIEAKVSTNE